MTTRKTTRERPAFRPRWPGEGELPCPDPKDTSPTEPKKEGGVTTPPQAPANENAKVEEGLAPAARRRPVKAG